MKFKKELLEQFALNENSLVPADPEAIISYQPSTVGVFLAIMEGYAKQFQDKFGEYQPGQTPSSYASLPILEQDEIMRKRQLMLQSEYNELLCAFLHRDVVEIIDGIADVAFIAAASRYIQSGITEYDDDDAPNLDLHIETVIPMMDKLESWMDAVQLPDIMWPTVAKLVGENNLSKWEGDPSFNKNGKLLKPAGYKPVDLTYIAMHSGIWKYHAPLENTIEKLGLTHE